MDSQAEILLDLDEIGSDLQPERRLALLAELKKELPASVTQGLGIEVRPLPMGTALGKSGELVALSGLVMAVSAAGGLSYDPAKVKRIFETIWTTLQKYLGKGTEVKITSGGKTITINNRRGEDTIALLEAAAAVAAQLAERPKSKAAAKQGVKITPKKK